MRPSSFHDIVSQRIHWIRSFVFDGYSVNGNLYWIPVGWRSTIVPPCEPTWSREGRQTSGDYRDKFDLKISYRRMEMGEISELLSVARSYFEFGPAIASQAVPFSVTANGIEFYRLLKLIEELFVRKVLPYHVRLFGLYESRYSISRIIIGSILGALCIHHWVILR